MKEGGSGHANNNNKCSVLTAATSHLTQPTMLGAPLVHLHPFSIGVLLIYNLFDRTMIMVPASSPTSRIS